jgi:hypothetical protein
MLLDSRAYARASYACCRSCNGDGDILVFTLDSGDMSPTCFSRIFLSSYPNSSKYPGEKFNGSSSLSSSTVTDAVKISISLYAYRACFFDSLDDFLGSLLESIGSSTLISDVPLLE